MAKKQQKMAPKRTHNLSDLIGKKIKDITCREIDMDGDGENVKQFYFITCSDQEEFVLECNGNVSSQYATACLLDPNEFSDMMEEKELAHDGFTPHDDEEDEESEDDSSDEDEEDQDGFLEEFDSSSSSFNEDD